MHAQTISQKCAESTSHAHLRTRNEIPDSPGAEVLEVEWRREEMRTSDTSGRGRRSQTSGSSSSQRGTTGGVGTKNLSERISDIPSRLCASPLVPRSVGTLLIRRPCHQVATSHRFDLLMTLLAHLLFAFRTAPLRCAAALGFASHCALLRLVAAMAHLGFHHGEP